METSFKVSRKLKYIQIDYVTGLGYLPVQYHKYVWCLDKALARAFIKRVVEIEGHVKDLLAKDNMTYDFRLIMCLFLPAINNIATGLDIRSKIDSLELAERFVFSYDVKYKDAHKFCQETLEHVETTGKYDSYMKDWRRHDKHNDLVKEFNLPFKQLTLEDFRVNELKNIEHSLDKMLKIVRGNNE
jgi:hypothetical protein